MFHTVWILAGTVWRIWDWTGMMFVYGEGYLKNGFQVACFATQNQNRSLVCLLFYSEVFIVLAECKRFFN